MKTGIPLLLTLGAALATLPAASAETCTTLLFHPLDGTPFVQSCAGNPSYGGPETTECDGLVFNPLGGDELVWDCQQTQCLDVCWDTLRYFTPDPDTRLLGFSAGCGGDPGQTHAGHDSTYCAHRVHASETEAMLYFSEQDTASPGLCASLATSPGWRCVHVYL